MTYPFFYYGRLPAEFHEGANGGHLYEVRLRAEPTSDQRVQLARLLEERLWTGAADLASEPWLWSGPVVRFAVGERWVGSWRACFASVAEALTEAAQKVPIDQVVFLGAKQRGSHEWDRWTHQRRPEPRPGPRYPSLLDLSMLAYPRATDDALPLAAEDVAVEGQRAETRQRLQNVEARRTLASADGLSPFDGDRAKQLEPSRPTLPEDVLTLFDVPDPLWEKRAPKRPKGARPRMMQADGDHPGTDLVRPWAHIVRDDKAIGIAYIGDDGGRHEVLGIPQDRWRFNNLRGPWPSPDGRRLYFAVGGDLFEADIADGQAHSVFRAPNQAVVHLIQLDERWVCLTDRLLLLLDASDRSLLCKEETYQGFGCWPLLQGSLIVVNHPQHSWTVAWGLVGDRFHALREWKVNLRHPRLVDGQVVCKADGGKYVSLDDVLQRLDDAMTS